MARRFQDQGEQDRGFCRRVPGAVPAVRATGAGAARAGDGRARLVCGACGHTQETAAACAGARRASTGISGCHCGCRRGVPASSCGRLTRPTWISWSASWRRNCAPGRRPARRRAGLATRRWPAGCRAGFSAVRTGTRCCGAWLSCAGRLISGWRARRRAPWIMCAPPLLVLPGWGAASKEYLTSCGSCVIGVCAVSGLRAGRLDPGVAASDTIAYAAGPREEVRTGE